VTIAPREYDFVAARRRLEAGWSDGAAGSKCVMPARTVVPCESSWARVAAISRVTLTSIGSDM